MSADAIPGAGRPFRTDLLVRFSDCDPAGIVFYPRYFEMFNRVVEDWCASGLGMSFRELHMERGLGLPTVHIETDFIAPSRLGDALCGELAVQRVGRASVTISIRLLGADGAARVRGSVVLALIDLKEGRAVALPDALRSRMTAFMQ
jgi:4-hydroxybenzoyl-CoA thioesterase